MTTPDFSYDGRFQKFQKSLKHLRTVTQGIQQTAELERAIEVALVRYSRREQNGLLNYFMIDKSLWGRNELVWWVISNRDYCENKSLWGRNELVWWVVSNRDGQR